MAPNLDGVLYLWYNHPKAPRAPIPPHYAPLTVNGRQETAAPQAEWQPCVPRGQILPGEEEEDLSPAQVRERDHTALLLQVKETLPTVHA